MSADIENVLLLRRLTDHSKRLRLLEPRVRRLRDDRRHRLEIARFDSAATLKVCEQPHHELVKTPDIVWKTASHQRRPARLIELDLLRFSDSFFQPTADGCGAAASGKDPEYPPPDPRAVGLPVRSSSADLRSPASAGPSPLPSRDRRS